ncbi:hypothetical protein GCM10010246_59210 [Streptomyces cuspidosporus]|uniref:Uncharacterized protein n=1 Tax=Streptomyces cuspidosporus TaxID=66882 RepID=A0ABN3GTM5_9ACTN
MAGDGHGSVPRHTTVLAIPSWAVFVAIERHPERGARLRELERIIDTAEQDPTAAIHEIQQIRKTAEAEAGL